MQGGHPCINQIDSSCQKKIYSSQALLTCMVWMGTPCSSLTFYKTLNYYAGLKWVTTSSSSQTLCTLDISCCLSTQHDMDADKRDETQHRHENAPCIHRGDTYSPPSIDDCLGCKLGNATRMRGKTGDLCNPCSISQRHPEVCCESTYNHTKTWAANGSMARFGNERNGVLIEQVWTPVEQTYDLSAPQSC